MFLSVLAASAIIASTATPTSYEVAPPALAPNAVVLDCQVTGVILTDCRLVDGATERTAEALKLAAAIEVPAGLANGRIRVKLDVNP